MADRRFYVQAKATSREARYTPQELAEDIPLPRSEAARLGRITRESWRELASRYYQTIRNVPQTEGELVVKWDVRALVSQERRDAPPVGANAFLLRLFRYLQTFSCDELAPVFTRAQCDKIHSWDQVAPLLRHLGRNFLPRAPESDAESDAREDAREGAESDADGPALGDAGDVGGAPAQEPSDDDSDEAPARALSPARPARALPRRSSRIAHSLSRGARPKYVFGLRGGRPGVALQYLLKARAAPGEECNCGV